MKNIKKIIWVILTILVAVFVIYFLFRPRIFSGTFSGMVYDCQTGELISGARVQISQSGGLLDIDSGRHYEGQTDKFGNFSIKYLGGAGMVTVTKFDDNYLTTQGTFLGGKTKIGLMKQGLGDLVKGEYIIPQCRKYSECHEQKVVNGVTEDNITCSQILPQE